MSLGSIFEISGCLKSGRANISVVVNCFFILINGFFCVSVHSYLIFCVLGRSSIGSILYLSTCKPLSFETKLKYFTCQDPNSHFLGLIVKLYSFSSSIDKFK